MRFCIWVTGFLLISQTVAEDDSAEDLDEGVKLDGNHKIQGEKQSNNSYAFYGIRYATSERFKPSVLNEDHEYLSNASRLSHGYVCPQLPMSLPGLPPRNLTMNDDCLYLDVYVPSRKEEKKLPVMIWIHGGGYRFGDKDIYNATELAVSIRAVVVTINYRVDVMGFLNTEDGAAKGNLGIGDAKVAIEWISKNIAKFGGDPKKMSIFGESAGGGMVSALFLDPKVRSTIRAGIAMSGSILAPWGVVPYPKRFAFELGNAANCSNDTSVQIVECLGKLSVNEILDLVKNQKDMGLAARYLPTIDGDHIKAKPSQVIADLPVTENEPTLVTTYLREDFSFLILLMYPQFFNSAIPFDHTGFQQFVANQSMLITKCPQPNPEFVSRVLAYYNVSESDSRPALTQKLFWFSTDANFGYPPVKESFLYANRSGGSNQLGIITYDPKWMNLGAFHGLDLVHAFGGHFEKIMKNHTLDTQVTDAIRGMIRQVAQDGRMGAPDFGKQGQYMELGESKTWEKGTKDLAAFVKFWDELVQLPCGTANSTASK